MDIENYIASGILESYALGLCSKEEAAEVEKLCNESELVRTELKSVQETLNQYAMLHAAEPKAGTREAILGKITQVDLGAATETNPGAGKTIKQADMTRRTLPEEPANKPAGKVIPMKTTPARQYYLVAAVALCVMSLLGNIVLYSKWQNTEQSLVALNTEHQVIADNLKSNQVKLDRMSSEMAVMAHPSTQKVMLKGVEAHPGMLAMVYWNKESKEVYLEIKKLPEPVSGKQYQLWAMVDGKPVDAGMINMLPGDSAMLRMKNFANAQAFAITLEKQGGSPSPDLSQLYVIGALGS